MSSKSRGEKGVGANGPLISMSDYTRIHGVIRAVLDSVEAHTSEACIFFSLVGTYLLEKYHKVTAHPRAGAAFYSLGETPKPTVMTFAQFGDEDVISDEHSFHCWIECEGWIIDFMAPIFRENMARRGMNLNVPRRMFQRRTSTMGSSWDTLMNEGDFFLISNPELTNRLFQAAVRRPSTGDLAEVCAHWYRPTPRKIEPKIQMASDDGTVRLIELRMPTLTGAW